ncbi:MAG: hypothetical protein WC700_20135 [Gemmatimonadaceae bacterium]|jgi:hypothetical protein
MNPITAALIGLVAGIVIQAWRTSSALGCPILDVLKSGGGPGEEKSGGGPGEERK